MDAATFEKNLVAMRAWDQVLAERRRECAGVTARPDGLYLVGVDYPLRFGLPPMTLSL